MYEGAAARDMEQAAGPGTEALELVEEYATDRSRRSIEDTIAQNPGREDDVWAAAGASIAEALRNGSDRGRCGCGCEHGHGGELRN